MFLIGVGAAVIGWLAMHYLYWNTPTDERKRLMMVATMAVVLVCMATLQRALDACAKTGGRVVVPLGTYLTGSIFPGCLPKGIMR